LFVRFVVRLFVYCKKEKNKKRKKKKEKRKKKKIKKESSGSTSSSTCRYHECALEKCGFWKKQKNKYGKILQKVKKKSTKSLGPPRRPFQTTQGKGLCIWASRLRFFGEFTFLEHAARTAAYYNRIRTRPALHAEDR